MNPHALIQQCLKQQEIQGNSRAQVACVMPGRWGKTNTRRLFPGGPKGEIVGHDPHNDSGIVVLFNADEVIDALVKKLVEEPDLCYTLPDGSCISSVCRIHGEE